LRFGGNISTMVDVAQRHQAGSLPDFVIIGAQKGGTTTLYQLLAQHPHVRPAVRKELHYFSTFYGRGLEWYRGCFPAAEQDTITGEGSPYYLFHPHAPRRMAKVIPEARLIVMLRNPIDRAYSHYRHEVKVVLQNNRQTIEPLAFEDALELEELRLRGESEKMLQDGRYSSFNHQHFSYLSRGIYVDQLLRWFEFFGKGQMLILKSEDFFERTPEVLNRTLSFLGLPDWTPEAWEIFLKGNYEREMAPATRRQLETYFEPHNRRLYDCLGVDFDW
jgi:hypothetical protein